MLTTVRRGMMRRQAADDKRLTERFDRIARLQEEIAARQAKTDEQMRTSQAEWEARLAKERAERLERQAAWEARVAKERAEWLERQANLDAQFAETGKLVADLNKTVGGLQNTLGSLTEEAVAGQICENFQALGYKITKAGRNMVIKGADGRNLLEMDIFLENGDVAIPVEVKTQMTKKHVDDHLVRIEKLRRHMDGRGDRRNLVGAMAGGVVAKEVREYAQEKGLYVLVQNGESISLAESAPGFEPRVW